MSEQENNLWSTIIPVNVTQSKRILGFRIRNIVEGAIAAAIAGLLISIIPFVTKVQIIVTIGISGSFFVLNLLGIKGMSISECFINLLLSGGTKKIYHLRSIRYVGKKQRTEAYEGKTTNLNESYAEKGFRIAKEFIKEKTGKV